MQPRAWSAGLAALLLAFGSLASCGDDGGARVLDPEELGSVLLTAEELGPGWHETQRDVFTTREPENPSIDPSLWCPDAASVVDTMATLVGDAGADVEIEDSSEGLPVDAFHGIRQQAWSNTNAEAYLDAVGAATTTCAGVSWTAEDGSVYTAEPVTAPNVGDESVSVRLVTRVEAVDPTMVWRSHQTVARFGSTVMILQEGDLQGPDAQPVMTDDEYLALLDRAAAKVAGLAG